MRSKKGNNEKCVMRRKRFGMISPPRDMKFVHVEFKEHEHFFWPTCLFGLPCESFGVHAQPRSSIWHRYREHQELPAEDIATMEKKIWPTIPKGSRTGLIVVLPYSCEFVVAAARKGLG
jgi:hypothetical protein